MYGPRHFVSDICVWLFIVLFYHGGGSLSGADQSIYCISNLHDTLSHICDCFDKCHWSNYWSLVCVSLKDGLVYVGYIFAKCCMNRGSIDYREGMQICWVKSDGDASSANPYNWGLFFGPYLFYLVVTISILIFATYRLRVGICILK